MRHRGDLFFFWVTERGRERRERHMYIDKLSYAYSFKFEFHCQLENSLPPMSGHANMGSDFVCVLCCWVMTSSLCRNPAERLYRGIKPSETSAWELTQNLGKDRTIEIPDRIFQWTNGNMQRHPRCESEITSLRILYLNYHLLLLLITVLIPMLFASF